MCLHLFLAVLLAGNCAGRPYECNMELVSVPGTFESYYVVGVNWNSSCYVTCNETCNDDGDYTRFTGCTKTPHTFSPSGLPAGDHCPEWLMQNEALELNVGDDKDDKWSKYGDVIGKGNGVIENAAKTAKDPTQKSIGELLGSIGAVASLSGGPVGMVIGGVLGLTGGLLSIFAPSGPSNQDIMDALKAGFANVTEKLDTIEQSLADMSDALSLICEEVTAIYKKLAFKSFDTVGSIFQEAMLRLKSTLSNSSSPQLMDDFFEYVQKERDRVSEVYSDFEAENVAQIIKTLTDSAHGNTCGAMESLASVIGARHQYFWIMFMGSLLRPCPKNASCFTPTAIEYANLLKKDIQAYKTLAQSAIPDNVLQARPSWRRQHSSDLEYQLVDICSSHLAAGMTRGEMCPFVSDNTFPPNVAPPTWSFPMAINVDSNGIAKGLYELEKYVLQGYDKVNTSAQCKSESRLCQAKCDDFSCVCGDGGDRNVPCQLEYCAGGMNDCNGEGLVGCFFTAAMPEKPCCGEKVPQYEAWRSLCFKPPAADEEIVI